MLDAAKGSCAFLWREGISSSTPLRNKTEIIVCACNIFYLWFLGVLIFPNQDLANSHRPATLPKTFLHSFTCAWNKQHVTQNSLTTKWPPTISEDADGTVILLKPLPLVFKTYKPLKIIPQLLYWTHLPVGVVTTCLNDGRQFNPSSTTSLIWIII